jgi:hypothetical protein
MNEIGDVFSEGEKQTCSLFHAFPGLVTAFANFAIVTFMHSLPPREFSHMLERAFRQTEGYSKLVLQSANFNSLERL